MTKKKITIAAEIPVTFLKESNMFVAYSPVLDLSSCGETFEEAKKNFADAINIFFEECIKHNTLDKALQACGWQKKTKSHSPYWQPPAIVGEVRMPIHIPA